MKKKCFDWEQSFAFIWNSADNDGIWCGNGKTLAAKFGVKEDEAHDVLSNLCSRGLIEELLPGTYAILRWPEKDDRSTESDLRWWQMHG
jgi:hypothetical protein